MNSTEKIEILPVDLLNQQRPLVNVLKKLASSLEIEFGWHYLLDLTWIISHLGPVKINRLMDAGAGTGIMQWYLAEQGAEVISVDRASRANLPMRFRKRYKVSGLRPTDLLPTSQMAQKRMSGKTILKSRSNQLRGLVFQPVGSKDKGQVIIYNQDLKCLLDLPDDTLDGVVAVSALEHNSPEDLKLVVDELLRVLKPGKPLLATLCAARDQDWFHEPSSGWCYAESSLRSIFDLPADAPANYGEYDALFKALKNCAELRKNLASFYFHSGNNGMPWGKWDPQYLPVGVCKIKKPHSYEPE